MPKQSGAQEVPGLQRETAALPTSVEGWANFIEARRCEMAKAEEELAGIMAERRGIAVAATGGGDPEARARLVELNHAHGELVARLDNLRDAVAAASAHLDGAQEARARLQAEERLAEGNALGEELVARAREVDVALGTLAGALRARAEVGRRLVAYGVPNKRNLSQIAGAARAAGLAGLMDLGTPARGHDRHMHRPLAEVDALAVGQITGQPSGAQSLTIIIGGGSIPGMVERGAAEDRRQQDAALAASRRAAEGENVQALGLRRTGMGVA